ncbi:MAG: TlyA family RNA methyltransferase [Christensenellales bacterium]|jgi:23S rRNA (cytidine1920-2'-O)/16S rRNA (cytidine1409-2'-O)-methyltransferase
MLKKERIDIYLCETGQADSREKAKSLVISGAVYIDGQRCDKPSHMVCSGQDVTLRQREAFVSRGGKKLEKAIQYFDINLKGKIAIDIGASTGGFTDCMLQNGAAYVFAVDVGHGQLAWRLRQDSRVCVMERQNARYLSRDMFDRDIGFASVDVSFISLKLVLPVLTHILTGPYTVVALIKPQFEAGRDKVGKKGVVRDKDVHTVVIQGIAKSAHDIGLILCGLTYSPIKGPEGNIEYLVCFKDHGEAASINISQIVEDAHNLL